MPKISQNGKKYRLLRICTYVIQYMFVLFWMVGLFMFVGLVKKNVIIYKTD